MNTPSKTVALLIDGDNAQLAYTKQIIEFCATYGTFKAKRAYGDWKTLPLSAHAETISKLSVKRVQQNRIGKNATDFGLAMDVALMLDKNEANIYFIVSSDGDFAAVCERIRQKGAKVIGIGNKSQKSTELRKICNQFFDVEEILKRQKKASEPKNAAKSKLTPKASTTAEILKTPAMFKLLSKAPTETKSKTSSKTAEQAAPSLKVASPTKSKVTKAKSPAPPKPKNAAKTVAPAKPTTAVAPKTKPAAKQASASPTKAIASTSSSETMLNLLVQAYQNSAEQDGWVSLTKLGTVLRLIDKDFEKRFANKRLSTWFKDFSHRFELFKRERVRMK